MVRSRFYGWSAWISDPKIVSITWVLLYCWKILKSPFGCSSKEVWSNKQSPVLSMCHCNVHLEWFEFRHVSLCYLSSSSLGMKCVSLLSNLKQQREDAYLITEDSRLNRKPFLSLQVVYSAIAFQKPFTVQMHMLDKCSSDAMISYVKRRLEMHA